MSAITDMIARGWENFLARPDGPVNFRFVMQPLVLSIVAIRAGIKDAKEGRPPYLWGAITSTEHRKAFLRASWKDIRVPFLISVPLDAIYQIIINRWIYPLELLFTAIFLALIPYAILRGPANRIARRILRRSRRPAAATLEEASDETQR